MPKYRPERDEIKTGGASGSGPEKRKSHRRRPEHNPDDIPAMPPQPILVVTRTRIVWPREGEKEPRDDRGFKRGWVRTGSGM